MPAATISTVALTAPWTAAGLLAFLKAQLPTVYGPLFDEYSDASNDYLVFSRVQSAAAMGTVYVRFQLPKALGTATVDVLQSWSVTNRTGTTLSVTQYINPAPNGVNTQMDLTLIAHNEFRAAYFRQGSTVDGFALVRPAVQPAWWNESTFPYVFAYRAATHSTLHAPAAARNPTGVALTGQWLDYRLRVSNPATTKRELVSGISIIGNNAGYGVLGSFADDVRGVAADGLALFDTLEVAAGTEEYLLLTTQTPYIAIRSI